MKKRRLRIGVIFGGKSVEHEISLWSASAVMKFADPKKYEIIPIGITKKGEWLVGTGDDKVQPKKFFGASAKKAPFYLGNSLNGKGIAVINGKVKKVALDAAFPVLHGTYGEDGTIQGLFEMADIPYVGGGVMDSALGINKIAMKKLFEFHKIPVAPWVSFSREEWRKKEKTIFRDAEKIGYPVFVKPASLGSSVGITKVKSPKKLKSAVNYAFKFDKEAVIEKGYNIRDIEVSVIEMPDGGVRASKAGEIFPSNEFYDYEAKYLKPSKTKVAKLPKAVERKVRDYAARAFRAIHGAGYARVDFLVERKTLAVRVNEINTIPGFTAISMFPKLWSASGISFPRLIDILVQTAFARHRRKKRIETDFARYLPK